MAARALLLALGPAAGLGLGRFAYALVLPLMQAVWGLSYAEAGFLGSANTLGYFLGALSSPLVLGRVGYRLGFYGALLLQGPVLALTGTGYLPALLLRFVQGVLGAWIFVGGAALLMALGRSGRALGAYYGGVGLGLLLGPWLLLAVQDPAVAWVRLGLGAGALGLFALPALPLLQEPPPPVKGEGDLGPVRSLLWAYGLYGAGYIGYMTFVTTAVGDWALLFGLLGVGALFTGLFWGPWVERVGGKAGACARPFPALPREPPAPRPPPPPLERLPLRPFLPRGDHRHHPGLPGGPTAFRLAPGHGAFHRRLRPGAGPGPGAFRPGGRGRGLGGGGPLGLGWAPSARPGGGLAQPALRPRTRPPTKLAPKGRL